VDRPRPDPAVRIVPPDRPAPRRARQPLPRLVAAGDRLFAASRYLVIIPILCMFAGGATLLVAGLWDTVQAVAEFVRYRPTDVAGVRYLLLEFIEVVEIFLVAMVLYLISVGLYTLFIDATLPMPPWMIAHSLEDLEGALVRVVGATLGVLFLGRVVTWDGTRDLLRLGLGIAAVMVALTVLLVGQAVARHTRPPEA
jgi:uncharacterized membrane protein YqhA